MDDALVPGEAILWLGASGVLILVLMDDALVQKIYC